MVCFLLFLRHFIPYQTFEGRHEMFRNLSNSANYAKKTITKQTLLLFEIAINCVKIMPKAFQSSVKLSKAILSYLKLSKAA